MAKSIENSHLEKILKVINKSINDLYKEQNEKENKNPIFLDDLLECKQLGNKLISFDYFERSESVLDKITEGISDSKKFDKVCEKWNKIQKKETKIKERDLKEFLKLVVIIFEELEEI